MRGPSQCARIRLELGVYVLGAIAPADRARVSRHLASCPGCRGEAAGLARLPALLGARRHRPAAVRGAPGRSLRPGGTAGGWADRPGGRGSPPAAVAPGGSRRGPRPAAAAGWAPQVLHRAAPPHRAAPRWWAAAEGSNAATGARAAVRYSPQPWGTGLEASVNGIAAGTPGQIWAATPAGHRTVNGTPRGLLHRRARRLPRTPAAGNAPGEDGVVRAFGTGRQRLRGRAGG